jgi:pSer/pThr/pTyr-binding forkhead associated (FHA) protein
MSVNLVMFCQGGERRDFPLSGDTATIGRKDDCDIRIPLAEVSRHHAQLTLSGDTVSLKDLGSANGTFVNNKRVKEAKLEPGDHVVVGPVVFTLQVDGEPKDIRSVKTKLRAVSSAADGGAAKADSASGSKVFPTDDDIDPISALEALASSADQTALDAFDDEDLGL